jgi:hypothetical protein
MYPKEVAIEVFLIAQTRKSQAVTLFKYIHSLGRTRAAETGISKWKFQLSSENTRAYV